MEQFLVNKQVKILIYGAAAGGTILYGKLNKNGYRIAGFIDNRAGEIGQMCDLPVYSIEQIKEQNLHEQCVVVIAVKNVFEHSSIARNLMKHGIQNVIYKPYAVLKGYAREEQRELFEIHNQLIDHGYCRDGTVYKVKEIEKRQEQPKEYLLSKDVDTQTVFLPLPLLFENKDIQSGQKERNACFLYPHIQFFHFLQGDVSASPQYYVEYCEAAARALNSFAITEAWRKNVIRNRAEVYHEMNHAFLFQKDFFSQNAPEVEWNDKGYFNLKSGKHRAAFFASRRLMYIPVHMKNEDVEKWICPEKVSEVNKVLQKKEIYDLKAPVEHPYFYQMPCVTENFFYGLCCALAEKIGEVYYKSPLDNVIDKKKMYIDLDDYGFISRFFRRSGAFVCNPNEKDQDLQEALDDMFGLLEYRRMERQQNYDIAIIQIEDIDELKNWKKEHHADRCFVIAETEIVSNLEQIKKLYCGVAWNKQMVLGYLEEGNV